MPDTSQKQFKTTSADVAAFIEHRTNIIPELIQERPGELIGITFPSTSEVMRAAVDFASGCPEARLLGIRSRLYRRIREVAR